MGELSPAAVEAIVSHMNADHGDSVIAYARHFGGRPEVLGAMLLTISSDSMSIAIETPTGAGTIRIPFDHPLRDPDDARDTLIAMARAAS